MQKKLNQISHAFLLIIVVEKAVIKITTVKTPSSTVNIVSLNDHQPSVSCVSKMSSLEQKLHQHLLTQNITVYY